MAKRLQKESSSKLADELFPDELHEFEVMNLKPEQRRLHIESYDFSISTLSEYLKNGNMYIPKFQRGYVWSDQQASRLIESLIIQCPIPVIYLAQSKDEKLAVIDGNQRLTSIRRYLSNEFKLTGLTAYPELTGEYFKDLDPRFQRHINNRALRFIVILKETHPQVQFDVFERLNTGSNSLNAQELRHGLYYGPLMEMIAEIAKEKVVSNVFPKKYFERMKGEELILRFIAISENFSKYSQPVSEFINNYCKLNREIHQNKLEDLKKIFLDTFNLCLNIFGKEYFCYPPDKAGFRGFYVALFDAQMLAVSQMKEGQIENSSKNEIKKKFIQLFNDEVFIKSITKATPNKNNIIIRVNKIKGILE